MKFTRSRQRLAALAAALAVPAGTLVALPAAPAHAADVATISGQDLHEALFVAGDLSRVNENPREAVLERILQAMYDIEPSLSVSQARSEISQMRGAMTVPASAARTGASARGAVIQPMSIFRVDAYKAMLEEDAKKAARTERAKRAARKVIKESLTAQQDEKSLLAISPAQETWSGLGDYGYFSGDQVVTESFRKAAINSFYAQARDQEWADEAGQSTKDTIAKRVGDPDLAHLDGITDKINGETLTISGQDALDAANTALNGPDGLGLANAASLNTAAALAKAEEDIEKAKTEAEKKAAKERAEAIEKQWKPHLDKTKEVVKTTESALKLSVMLIGTFDPEAAKQIKEVGAVVVKTANQLIDIGSNVLNGVMNVVSGNWVGAAGNVINGVMGIFGLFSDESSDAPAPDPVKVALKDLSEQMEDFRQEMHERFDRIDTALNAGFTATIEGLNEILAALGDVNADLTDVKASLINVQSALIRLEARLFTSFRAVEGRRIAEAINAAIGYRELNNREMSGVEFSDWANLFYTGATSSAKDAVAMAPVADGYDAQGLIQQLNENPLDMNVEFLSQYATAVRGTPLANAGSLVNPRDWALSARAMELMMLQNPQYLTPVWLSRLREVRAEGVRLRTALAKIHVADTAAGTGNALLNALLDRYASSWAALDGAVDTVITSHASLAGGLSLWGGPRQPVSNPATITTTNNTVGTGAPTQPCTSTQHLPLGAGSSYADHVPAQATVAVALGIGVVNMCAEPSIIDPRTETDIESIGPGGRLGHIATTTKLGKLRAKVRWDYTHRAGTPTGKWLAYATRTWPEQAICETIVHTSTGGSFDPDDWTTETIKDTCGEADPEHRILTERWGSTGPAFNWTLGDQDILGEITGMVSAWLNDRQKAAYADVRTQYTRAGGSPVQSAAKELHASKRLLQSYVEAGFPADLLVDGELRGLISGAEDLPNDEADVQVPWQSAADGSALESTDPQQVLDETATERVSRLRELLGDHVRGTAAEPIPPLEFRAAPLVQTTITRLELSGFVLDEDADPAPVCVVKPAEVAAASAKLAAANAQLAAATKKHQKAKKKLKKTKKKLAKFRKQVKKTKKAGQKAKASKTKKKVRATKKKIKKVKVTVRKNAKRVTSAKANVTKAGSDLARIRDRCR